MDRSELIRVYLWPIPPRSTNLRLVVEATVIVTPVLDDWVAFAALVPKLDVALAATSERVTILVVDDGSSSVPAELALSHGVALSAWSAPGVATPPFAATSFAE